ncbi:Lsr2 family protein [Nocardioides sp.]|uniref:histone-like nucleoid-structuring protein Lsr2 n=1 Tax=Nocardioides sp. TaxID=35761 RepID=UPI003518D25B
MVQKINVVLVDDIDGSEAHETLVFALDGATYEIDLNEEHAAQLREALAPFLGHARKVSAGARRAATRSKAPAGGGGPSAREIRDWARSQGLEVPERGRIPAEIREAFESAS